MTQQEARREARAMEVRRRRYRNYYWQHRDEILKRRRLRREVLKQRASENQWALPFHDSAARKGAR